MTPRAAASTTTTVAVVIVVAIVLGAGGYYAGSISSSATTMTSTVTGAAPAPTTVTVTATATASASPAAGSPVVTAYGGGTTQTAERLVVDAGTAKGFYSSAGLNMQWLQSSPTSNYLNYPSLTAVGASVGIGTMSDALLAEANGVPITIVGAFSGVPATTTFFVLSGSSIKTAQDLAGKTVGVVAAARTGAIWDTGLYYAQRTGVNFTMIPEGNATNADNQLTAGKTDAMLGGISPLMPEGNIVIAIDPNTVYATPFAGSAIWATNTIIKSNPTLVKNFVAATLSTVNYLSQNSTYADNLYISDFQGTPGYVLPASSSVGNINYTPTGTGGPSGTTLQASVTDSWGFYSVMCTGTCNANLNVANAINASFLPGA
jgi:ABC-type nitrate/sulfonate/bicarbonate transport system substrate-binding protein